MDELINYIKESISTTTGDIISDKLAQEIISLAPMIGMKVKQARTFRHPKQMISIAAAIHDDTVMAEWKERRRVDDQVVWADMLIPHYKGIMEALTTNYRKILIQVLLSYNKGITNKELATITYKSEQVVASLLSRLKKYNLVDKENGKWKVTDKDFLLVTATRWDPRWPEYWKVNRDIVDHNVIVDKFIESG